MLNILQGYLGDIIYIVPISLFSLTIHELSHGFVAYKLGDPTAKDAGRLTLNPLKHLDLIGVIMMVVLRFGWAKPVPVNPLYFKNPKKGMMLTALAGPVSNLLTAFVSSFLLVLFTLLPVYPSWLYTALLLTTYLNIGLAVFNLIPVYPLDGSRILGYFMPNSFNDFFVRYGNYIYIAFFLLVVLTDYVGNAVFFVQSGISNLFITLWQYVVYFIVSVLL